MIVKFHARGRGGGAGPVDYLLGKDRNRAGATVLQGKPEEVRELIDASPYAKKYTSGVLSFEESALRPGQREKLMESFEKILLPGLDKDQYSVLWVEHTDKGRIELNFVIPNTELLTGKRLQPYYDRADRPRIDAWQTIVNGRMGFSDPNDPLKKRNFVTPRTLPAAKQEAVSAITHGLMTLVSSGMINTRQDVTDTLEKAGFEVARTTKNSISIADPEGGRNIRLRGAIYEQSFNAGAGFREEIKSASDGYRNDAESRIQRAYEICKTGTERKHRENQQRYKRLREGDGFSHEQEQEKHVAYSQSDVADHRADWHDANRLMWGNSEVAGEPVTRQAHCHPGAGKNTCYTGREGREHSVEYLRGETAALSENRRERGEFWGESELHDTTGVLINDRTGTTVAERIRAVTAGLLATAGRLGERLCRVAEDVWSFATGERHAERARYELEQAGAEFQRAAAPLIDQLNRIEQRREQDYRQRLKQQEAAERRQRNIPRGPSPG